jgi:membrane protease YdiL (CAAX protease family)
MALPEPEPSHVAKRWAWAALFVYPPTVALGYILRLSALDAFVLAALVALLPLLAVAQVPLAKASLAEAAPLDRCSVYLGSTITVLLLGGVTLAAGLGELGASALGLGMLPLPVLLAWSCGLLVTAITAFLLFHELGQALGMPGSPLLAVLLPETVRERRLFMFLSLAAGLGEEVAFRGYVLAQLVSLGLGPWGAAIASAVPFGVLHAYQGWWGSLRTGLLGFTFAASVVLSGSLWPAVIAHVGIDVVGGLWLGRWLLTRS